MLTGNLLFTRVHKKSAHFYHRTLKKFEIFIPANQNQLESGAVGISLTINVNFVVWCYLYGFHPRDTGYTHCLATFGGQ